MQADSRDPKHDVVYCGSVYQMKETDDSLMYVSVPGKMHFMRKEKRKKKEKDHVSCTSHSSVIASKYLK